MKYSVPLFVAFMAADLLTTYFGLQYGARETNPLWKLEYMFGVKVMATLIILSVCYTWQHWKPIRIWLRTATTAMGLVVANNLLVLTLQM